MHDYARAYAVFTSEDNKYPGGIINFVTYHKKNVCNISIKPLRGSKPIKFYITLIAGDGFKCTRKLIYDYGATLIVNIEKNS